MCQVHLTDGNYVSIRKVTHVCYKIVQFVAICQLRLCACQVHLTDGNYVSIRKVHLTRTQAELTYGHKARGFITNVNQRILA